MTRAVQFSVRENPANRQALVLLHGFGGDAYRTFGMMPAFIAGDSELQDWDIRCFGYPTGLAPDLTGIWSSDPDLASLAEYLVDEIEDRLERYDRLAFVAHSMGGLILQRALLDGRFGDRVRHVLLFGVPSGGLLKARLGRMFKSQVRDMDPRGRFIADLRRDWNDRLSSPRFTLGVVAGLSDQFVPRASSLEPFPPAFHRWVLGNHVEQVKPATRDTDSCALVRATLAGRDEERRGPSDALTVADAADSPEAIVKRALTLELSGRQSDAIALLQENRHLNSYVAGALAGRHKRRWFSDPDGLAADGALALEIYLDAMGRAAAAAQHGAAAYVAINAAFMTLAYGEDAEGARRLAETTLEHNSRSGNDLWREATGAEAELHLGRHRSALGNYRLASAKLDPRQRSSMFQQAVWTARLLERETLENALEAMMLLEA